MSVEPPLDTQNLVQRAVKRQVRLPEYSQPVYIEDAQAIDDLISVSVRTRDGQTDQIIVPAADLAAALDQTLQQRASSELANPLDFFLLVEAARIRLAYSFDPFFAVSMSGVQALPHQLQAVYERMLPQARLRFLLADDPGAGKTIMAGLLLKELKLRGVINYILILTPAPLTIQWQDELYSKFDETFEIVNSEMVGNQLAGNVWDRYRQCITSLDFAKQERVVQSLEQIPWDLVIIDEAHKCSARTQGEKVVKTKRYQLAERLSASAERILLLTATPHNGDPSQFAHFLRLLDADQFPDPRYDGLQLDRSIMEDSRAGGRDQWFLRRIKEELRDRDGNPLFTKRHARTVPFELTWAEKRLYDHVTQYINRFLPYQQGGTRRSSVALARTVLQRRLASSLNAIHRSLKHRATKFKDILQELERVPASEHEKILQKYRLLASSGYEDEEREGDDLDERQDEAMESFPVVLCVDQLRDGVHALENLVQEATSVMASGEESKLKALRRCMEDTQFHELTDGRGKLLIFTEHRDTLEYLRRNLQQWGYSTCEIHGGMNAVLRREAAQRFHETAQVCLATEQEYGVYEHELLSVCLAPGLNRNILQTALHDLNERLLYLHQHELRYRFETQPNLNKMIIDENQRRSREEIEERFRLECSKAICNERGAIVWPNDTQDVRDRLPEFQIVYLSPSWLDTHSVRERQEQGMQRYIEQCGNGPRRYRNGLALAIPDHRMVEAARNAVRLILTLELVQSQSTQRQLSPQQDAELAERKRNAENELKGAISQLYPIVYTPQNSEQSGQTYVVDALTVQSYSSAPQLHTRMKEALRNRVVWDSLQPSKIAAQVQLNELQPLEHQHYAITALVSCFFSFYSFAHIWDEKVVRQAIVVGIKNRTFGYVANARKDEQGSLHFGGPVATSIQFGKDVPAHEIDMGEGAFLLSAAYATQLLRPPKVEPVVTIPEDTQAGQQSPPEERVSKTVVNEPQTPEVTTVPPTVAVAPGQGGRRYHLRLRCKPTDFYEVMKALEKLNDSAMSMNISVAVVATAKPGEAFVANTMHNLVVEPMTEESEVFVEQELVEE